MPIILLSKEIVAGISAGEVIERPASVVKELLENSIDSGASRVKIDISGGGMKLIRVADDGSGMQSKEALLAFSRHATSKLETLSDLSRIATFGFRGEALAAIASAGTVEMLTRSRGLLEGTRISGGAGEELSSEPAGCPEGTTITVRRLFSAMPARLKFLKAPQSETAAIVRIVEPYVLSREDVHIILTVDGEERLNISPRDEGLARARKILGAVDVVLETFILNESGIKAHGYAERPGTVSRRGRQWIMVNGRPVEDRSLRHALISSYSGQMPRDTQPYAIVRIDLPPDRVDVNVHPAKSEVRFADPSLIYRILHRSLRKTFGEQPGSPGPLPAIGTASQAFPSAGLFAGEQALELAWEPAFAGPSSGVEVLGQLFRTYIAVRTAEGLLLVDQHTAAEKAVFEKLRARKDRDSAQGIMLSQALELSPAEFITINANAGIIREVGLEFDSFGGNSIMIRSVPAEARDRDILPLLRWLLEDLEQAGRIPSREDLQGRLTATMACHLAVRAGEKLSREAMEKIVRDLLSLADPLTCPHGRPTYVRFDEGELARLFRRTWGLGKRECH
jgi:DNA mismatch repair protein MutL